MKKIFLFLATSLILFAGCEKNDPEQVEDEGDSALPGIFTVNAQGKKVRFSKGNLQATYKSNTRTYTWDFAANQYSYVGNAAGNASIDSLTDGAVVDLFGWSTSMTYYGISTSTRGVDYPGAFVDWGKAYCASNGIAAEGTWRTLSKDEWTYLFNDRTMTNGKERYSNAVAVGGVTIEGKTYKGAFLYPDNYNGDVVSGSMTWDGINAAGIVFLPAAGYREGSGVLGVDGGGTYWSSSADDEEGYEDYAHLVIFWREDAYPDDSGSRHYGFSVRLITESN